MDENFIYDDLATQGDLGEIINDLQTRNNELQQHVCSLEGDIQKLCDKITEMKKVQDNLSKNISELFNTAKNELERKDRRIGELQNQLDEIIFRRRQPHSGLKRKCVESYPDEINKRSRTETVNINSFDKVSETLVLSDDEQIIGESKEQICKNIPGKLKPESDIRDGPQQESDLKRSTHSRENSYSRDRREHNRDFHRNDSRERNANHRNTDNRDWEMRKDFRDNYRGNKDHRHYRDRSRGRNQGYRSSNQEYRTSHRDYRDSKDNWRNNRESHTENNERKYNRNEDELRERNNSRNEKYDDYNCATDQQTDWHSRNEPVFSAGKSTNRNIPAAEEYSREEGEVFDEEPGEVTEIEEDISRKNLHNVRNVPTEVKKSSSTHKSIAKQERRPTKNSVSSNEKHHDNQEDELKDLNNKNMLKNKQNLKKTEDKELAAGKRVNEIDNVKAEDMRRKQETVSDKGTSHGNNEICTKEHVESNTEKNVKIISQIILNEGVKDTATECASKSKSEVKNKTQCKNQENKEKPPITIPKIDKRKRESRVPRNLTDELNINLERSKKKQDLMHELFGSSEKRRNFSRIMDQVSPKHVFSLSDDGEIPKLKLFSNSDMEESNLRTHFSEVKKDTNPVTEFQIFKTNLPSLEKSNSLSSISVQIQTPDCAHMHKESVQNSEQKDEKFLLMEENKFPNQNEKLEKVSTHPVVEKEANFGQSTSDICSMSFVDVDIRQCKAEDFPNLNAVLDSSLLAPEQKNLENVSKKFVTQVSIEKENAITNIQENYLEASKPLEKEQSNSSLNQISSKTTKNEEKNDSSKTISKECRFSSKKNHSMPQISSVADGMPSVDDEPQSASHSNHPIQKCISVLLTPIEETKVPRTSINTNGISRKDSDNTKKPLDPKKGSKPSNKKQVSPSKMKIQKQSNSTEIKEDKGTNKSANSSKSVASTDSKDMSDLLSVPVEKNLKTISKKCTNSSRAVKTGSSRNRDKKNIDPCVPISSDNLPKASNKKSIPSSGIGDKIKISNPLEAPVDKEVEGIAHQKSVTTLGQVSVEAAMKAQKSNLPNDMKQCKTEIATSHSDSMTTVKNISQKSNVIDSIASDKYVNISTIDTTAVNLSLKTAKTIDLNKKPLNQNDLEDAPNKLVDSKVRNTTDRKRRRCAIKLV